VSFGAEFLVEPDLFPGRASGDLWGGESLALDVAGGPYRILGASAAQAAAIRERFGPLVGVAREGQDVPVRLFWAPESDFLEIPFAGWQTRFDLDSDPRAVRVAGRRWMARLDWGESLQTAIWTSSDADRDFLGLFENGLRVVVAYRSMERGGALLHSAGVVAGGKAYIFFGHSGAGKSTLSELSARVGLEVLSDELNVVIDRDGTLEVERLPFAGDFGREAHPRSAHPLAGLFRLQQAPSPFREPLHRARAVAALAGCAPFVNADPVRGPRLLENLERLTGRCEVETLGFALDPGFWSIVAPAR